MQIVLVVWHSASVVHRMNEATMHSVQLVLGWVTVFGRAHHLGM